ncbi:DUF58 domain-containing protein [Alkalihalobacterium chitinilyticum]|uniref:DUF58 domain-containing protein n=1 Tax=Alkalihalobacterium chitinilyticum TaxID=2980103 RepID=A0ABT5VLC1_9BACI|nr:DUF58 domain-containing protein [Alkalihalobacterium chitinilyticum]MDE5416214.1 DUF58 domain-containing protein [Alkalihalobacterium chitinilyticum]
MKLIFSSLKKGVKPLFLLLLNITLFAYAMFQGGFVSWFLFYSIVVISLLSISVFLFTFQRIDAYRTLSADTLRAYDDVEVEVFVKNKLIHPFCFVRVKDQLPQGLEASHDVNNSALFFLSFKRTLDFKYTIEKLPRGEHCFREIEVVIGDMFGFFERKKTVKVETTVLVFPHYQSLKSWSVNSGGGFGESVSFAHSLEEELSIAGVRHYIPGDRLTSIDWKHSARSEKLMTKEFETSQGEAFHLFFNRYVGKSAEETFERAVELTASIAEHCYENQNALSFVSVGTDTEVLIPDTTLEHYQMLYFHLAKVQGGKEQFLPTETSLLEPYRNGTIIFVTVSLNQKDYEWLQYLRAMNIQVIVCWVSGQVEDQQYVQSLRMQRVKVYQFTDEKFNSELMKSR